MSTLNRRGRNTLRSSLGFDASFDGSDAMNWAIVRELPYFDNRWLLLVQAKCFGSAEREVASYYAMMQVNELPLSRQAQIGITMKAWVSWSRGRAVG